MLFSQVPPQRNKDPFEIIFSAVFAISGAAQLIMGARPGSVDSLLPGWFSTVWLLLIVLGSVGVLVGAFWRNTLDGIFIESVSLSAVGAAVCIYGAGLIVVEIEPSDNPAGGWFAGPLTIALGLAFWWKHRQLQKHIRELPKK